MACLIKSKNKPLLDSYTSMLGSEQAAYYVLCKNNGYPLEFTPNGEKSDLFQLLLAKNNYDYEDAIREKSEMYYSSYYDKIGGDWTMISLDGSVVDSKGEPKISYKPNAIDFSDVFSQPIQLDETDIMSLPEIENNIIKNDLNNFLNKEKPIGIEEKHSKTVEWLNEKLKKLVNSINKSLIEAFGLEKHIDKQGNVTFVSKEKDEKGRYKLIIQFCEYLEDGKLGVYDLTGRLEAAANVILISLLDGNPITINHELAHHYIRMFWNSEVIQNAVQKLDNGDRSDGWQVRLEEKLVDEITKRTIESEGFWNKFGEALKSAFLWISSPIKQNLLRKASLAFRLNETSNRIKDNQYILSFIDPTTKRVFMSPINTYVAEFDRIKSSSNILSAVKQFIIDSENFYRTYKSAPDSIAKREYEEYLQHVKNELCSTTITDGDFNIIYILIQDEKSRIITPSTSPTSVEYEYITAVSSMIEEARLIRESLRTSSIITGTTGTTSTTRIDFDTLMNKIIKGLKTRIYEYLHTVPKAAKDANEILELLDKINILSDNKTKLLMFIQHGTEELSRLYKKLEELSRNNFDDLSSQLLYSFWNTIDGFYSPIIDIIYKELGGTKKSIILGGILSTVGTKLSQMTVLCQDIRSSLKDANQIISKRETHKFLEGDESTGEQGVISDLLTDELKERFLENFDDLLIIGKLFEDINMLLPYIGLSSRSRSIVIRVARNMILSANSDIRKATLKDTAKIMKLYFRALPELRKLGLREVQSIFQEMDEKGLPTGYFVRRLNYGKFYRDLDLYRTNLINKANERLKLELGASAPLITYDIYNNPILPPDDDVKVKSILLDYADELDDWMCDNAERMFVTSYYKQRRKMLSPHTRRVMLDIQNRIQSIMSKAPVVKITDSTGKESDIQATWELSPEDLQNLVLLKMEYQQLSNHYYSDGTKKTGEELKIAEEISKFNEWKGKLVSYKLNDDKFNASIKKIREKYGLNSLEEARFRKLNTSIKVNPKYYEYVMSKVSLASNPALDALRKRRNDLKKLIDEFDKKGIDVEQKRRLTEYWESLKEIDSQIAELLDSIASAPVPEENRWSTYFDKEFVMYDDSETLLDHMLKQDILEYRRTHPADTRTDEELRKELISKYQYTYEYTDKTGEKHIGTGLVSVFVRQVPRGANFHEASMGSTKAMDGTYARNALIVEYSLQFSDVDPDSSLYNSNFDRSDSRLVLPKSELYENSKQWDKIKNNEKIKDLYDALIELMNRNSAKLPTNSDFNYKLPQITGRRLTILRRSGSIKELCDALKYNFEMDWKLNERDDADVNYEDEDLKLRANGTRINTVPSRYIKTLDRPEFITSDVIGSVIAFTEMANNFVVKTQLSSELEIIKQQLLDRENSGVARGEDRLATTNIIQQLSNMMDDLLYANNTKYGSKNSEFSKKETLIIKFMTRFQHLGRILMLGYNFTSMSVGFFESFIRGNLEAFLGKDYTLRDLMHAYAHMARYSIPTFGQVGSVNVKNKQIALMQWFGISKRLTESYRGTERRRLIKVLNENLNGMFGFTLGDYANSSLQLAMALSNVRFIDNGVVDSGFYTKQTLIKAILKKHKISYKEAKLLAIAAYKESGICLEDAYDFKDGELSVKSEYLPYVNSVLENRVTGKCYQRLAEALGVVPQNDNPGYGLLILLRPLGVLRNYLFTVIARNWNWSHDFQKRYLDEKGNIVKEDDMLDGYLDIDAGNMNIGLHQGLIGWLKMTAQNLHIIEKTSNSLSEETKELYNYAAAKVALEILSIAALVGISVLFKAMAKGADDDDWFYRFGYLTSVRLVNSFISVLDPTAFLEVIKNISTLISPLNDFIRCITILSDMLGLSGHSPFDEILSGSYKGRSRLFRNLMRITPLGNAYEDLTTSALKSRANWYIQQDPITWGSIGGIYDLLWDAGN